ncbi:MAG: response regulator [Burkholderiales bacterium]
MRVLIVDDHAVTREGLRQFLLRRDPTTEVVEAASCAESVAAVTTQDFALVLLDLGLADAQGIEALSRLRDAAPGMSVVVFSGNDDPDTVAEVLELGARGFLSKGAPADEFRNALADVMDGLVRVPSGVIAAQARMVSPRAPEAFSSVMGRTIAALTPRQREVLDLIVAGLTNKLIGRALGISPETAKVHVSGVLRALGAPNRARVVVAAAAAGITFPHTGASRP